MRQECNFKPINTRALVHRKG